MQCCIYAFIFVAVTTHSNHTVEHFPYIKREYPAFFIFFLSHPQSIWLCSVKEMNTLEQEYFRVPSRNYQWYTFLACNLHLQDNTSCSLYNTTTTVSTTGAACQWEQVAEQRWWQGTGWHCASSYVVPLFRVPWCAAATPTQVV